MLQHHYSNDAWYAEQAALFEAGRTVRADDAEDHIIPLRWILAWTGALGAASAVIATIISWLA